MINVAVILHQLWFRGTGSFSTVFIFIIIFILGQVEPSLPCALTGLDTTGAGSCPGGRSAQPYRRQNSRLIRDEFATQRAAGVGKDRTDGGLKTPLVALIEMEQGIHQEVFLLLTGNRKKVLSDLRGLSVRETIHKLRATPLRLAEKMEIRYRWR